MRKVALLFLVPFLSGLAETEEAGQAEVQMLAKVVCSECLRCPRGERLAITFSAINRKEATGRPLHELLEWPAYAKTGRWCQEELPPPPPRDDGLEGWSPTFVRNHEERLAQIEEDTRQALQGRLSEHNIGATHFHTKKIDPGWNFQELEVPEGWKHRFYYFEFPSLVL